MKYRLPKEGPYQTESAIVNLDDASGSGTHWVAYRKIKNKVIYFDSFGDLSPPKELMNYWNVDEVKYNYQRFQNYNSFNCGHLCLKFLSRLI